MKRTNVILPKDKIREAYLIAKKRNQKEAKYGAMTYGGVRGGFEAHLVGMLGEMAVAHHFGLDVDKVIYDDHGDDGIDLAVAGFGLSQVKTTTYWQKPFLRVELEHYREDVKSYFLCALWFPDIPTTRTVEIVGWAPQELVAAQEPRRLGPQLPLNYILEEQELQPLEAVLA